MLFFSNIYFALAQDCTSILQGTVVDYHDGTALANASILVVNSNIQTTSDSEGNYSLTNLCDGSYEIEVSHPSCETLTIPVTINGTTVLEIKLEHHLEELEEVKVVGDAIFDKTLRWIIESIHEAF